MKILGITLGILTILLIITIVVLVAGLSFGFVSLIVPTWPLWAKYFATVFVTLAVTNRGRY